MIMVDELVSYGQKAKGGARYFGSGKQSCHLTTDGPIEELHTFAVRIGLRREWCQHTNNPIHIHYDLTPNKREQALKAGAVFVPGREQAMRRVELIRKNQL
jgi:hypothetical protein